MLARIEACCAAKQWSDALDLALGVWRQTNAPAYADLVEAISPKTKAPAIPRRLGQGAFHTAWLERAAIATESDVVPLLATFGTELSTDRPRVGWDTTAAARRVRAALRIENVAIGEYDFGPFMAISARVEALAALGRDPRVARTLLAFVRNPPIVTHRAISVATYGPVLDLIAETRDVRLVPALERMLSDPPDAFFEPGISRVLDALRRVVVETPADAEAAAALAYRLGFRGEDPKRAGVDVSDLIELVMRDLEDDAPRAVIADRWLEVGDPRGELVTLQLRGSPTAKELERVKAIVWYDREWLGDLAVVTRSRVYERGFLAAIALSPEAAATPARWAAAARDPQLGTVRRLAIGAANEANYRAFLFSPAMRNLEEAEIPSLALLREVLAHGKLRRVSLGRLSEDDLRKAHALPNIERVTVR
jgi:hypothetical protein